MEEKLFTKKELKAFGEFCMEDSKRQELEHKLEFLIFLLNTNDKYRIGEIEKEIEKLIRNKEIEK